MPHFFIDSNNIKNNKIVINDKDNYNHIAKSLRAKIDEKLLLIDENQIQYETVIEEITNKEITVHVKNSYKFNRVLDFKLYLAQSPLRSDAQNIIIEKATELGVEGIYPIYTDNCSINRAIINKKIDKWQRIMYAASKQCERAYIPKCFETMNLKNLLELKDNNYKIIAFCERYSDYTLHQYCDKFPIKKDDKIVIIIGPEGGFSQQEFEFFRQNDIPMLTLGNLILKAETAVVVALGNIIYEYENYKKN